MSFKQTYDFGSESGEDAIDSTEALEARLSTLRERIISESRSTDLIGLAKLRLDEGELLNALERGEEAWKIVRPIFDLFSESGEWELAAEACDVLSQTEHDDALVALANGIWLAVTFPVDPQISVSLLQYVIDDTPDDSDGAAVAAAVAKYVIDMRAEEDTHNDLSFFATQMMGEVARRHSNVENQQEFDRWTKKLELDDPEKFLVRMRNVLDVMAQDNWWVDRAALRDALPQTA
jgi:hypothetical protein